MFLKNVLTFFAVISARMEWNFPLLNHYPVLFNFHLGLCHIGDKDSVGGSIPLHP